MSDNNLPARAFEIYREEGFMSLSKSIGKFIRNRTPSPRRFVHSQVGKRRLEANYGKPLEVMEEDWDNLILLDACRYDVFEEHNPIDGELHRVVTAGSHSDEFIIENFHGRKLHDTVYITANPHADKTLNDGIFHNVIRTYGTTEYVNRPYDNHHPKSVARESINAFTEFPDKRLIIHFMQPHTPYLGPTAERVRDKYRKQGLRFAFTDKNANYKEKENHCKSIITAARDGHVSRTELERCYAENLNLVLEEVERLLGELEGKSVISADHGEMLGDPTPLAPFMPHTYSHPSNTYSSELRLVPWLIIESDQRRRTETEPPLSQDEVSEQAVNEQLEALGYKT